jgi:hypothetical protein
MRRVITLDPLWLERKPHIERLVIVEHLDDAAIAERYGVRRKTLTKVRRALGIEPPRETPASAPMAMQLPTTTYIDAEGNRVTLCAPGLAEGAEVRRYTARSRASR